MKPWCRGATLPGKRDPAIFLLTAQLTAQRLGVSPQQCVVIEDASVGVAGAKAAGARCIALAVMALPAALREADLILDRLDLLTERDVVELLSDI